jgi:hypothetical protein
MSEVPPPPIMGGGYNSGGEYRFSEAEIEVVTVASRQWLDQQQRDNLKQTGV